MLSKEYDQSAEDAHQMTSPSVNRGRENWKPVIILQQFDQGK